MHERWQSLFGDYLNTSFTDALRAHSPERFQPIVLPSAPAGEPGVRADVPRGTTILALRYADGVIVAGDRQATEGYQVAHRRIEKVYKADDYSAIAIAGAAGPSIEMARLFQTELEHYEKVEGDGLSLEGKANKLGQMIRMNLPAAMQGLVVVPIFAGYDVKRGEGRIFKYDITGGRYEEIDYYATGSGGKDARTTLKKLYRPAFSRPDALRITAEALIDAAEEDVGTGGPDLVHGIYPSAKAITRSGFEEIAEDEIRKHCEAVLTARREANSRGVGRPPA
jgi:proteasome beta subunit